MPTIATVVVGDMALRPRDIDGPRTKNLPVSHWFTHTIKDIKQRRRDLNLWDA